MKKNRKNFLHIFLAFFYLFYLKHLENILFLVIIRATSFIWSPKFFKNRSWFHMWIIVGLTRSFFSTWYTFLFSKNKYNQMFTFTMLLSMNSSKTTPLVCCTAWKRMISLPTSIMEVYRDWRLMLGWGA
jgi:hypothetical protein